MATASSVVITDNHQLEDAVIEMHDDLLRLVDNIEAGSIAEGIEEFDSARAKMEAIRIFLSTLDKS